MSGSSLVWTTVLAALAVGCSSAAATQTSIWKGYRPTTPLPAFAGELGRPCAGDWGGSPLRVKCGRGRAAIVIWRDHQAVTGRWEPMCGDACFDRPPPLHFSYPPRLSAKSDGKHAYAELSLYIDGPLLWIKDVALQTQFGGAALTIVDRRLLSRENERWLAESLHLASPADVYDDRQLIRGVERYREP